MLKTWINSKLQIGCRWPLMTIFDQLLYCLPSSMVSITKKHKKWLLSLTETCNKNWTPLKLGQSSTWICCQSPLIVTITRNHKSGIGLQPLAEITKSGCHHHRINTETYIKNWTPLSLPQSSTSTCQPSLMTVITKHNRNGCLLFVMFGND